MLSFCPHCGQTIGGAEQIEGKMLMCRECGKPIGIVATPPKKVMIDETEELLRQGSVARCAVCNKVVELKAGALVPHYAEGQKEICRGSGKPVKPAEPAKVASQDLRPSMNRDVIKVVLCKQAAEPGIEELLLEYLDKADRVRLQIETLRDILGPTFRMQEYPRRLGKPGLAIWGNTSAVVVAKKHEHGGYQPMTDAEIATVLDDIRNNRSMFRCDGPPPPA
jgi:hypothetical protein